MDYSTKSELINALKNEFKTEKVNDNYIDSTNFISETVSIDSTALGLDVNTLRKTKSVIEEQEKRFMNDSSVPDRVQLLAHLRVAKKCVQEVISMKLSTSTN
ncbi:MAG: hypothetical protein K6E13_09625 [Lachnospiraceae bacterium]|nr:hypothetical protein [Lachnospiraceae bacterium]